MDGATTHRTFGAFIGGDMKMALASAGAGTGSVQAQLLARDSRASCGATCGHSSALASETAFYGPLSTESKCHSSQMKNECSMLGDEDVAFAPEEVGFLEAMLCSRNDNKPGELTGQQMEGSINSSSAPATFLASAGAQRLPASSVATVAVGQSVLPSLAPTPFQLQNITSTFTSSAPSCGYTPAVLSSEATSPSSREPFMDFSSLPQLPAFDFAPDVCFPTRTAQSLPHALPTAGRRFLVAPPQHVICQFANRLTAGCDPASAKALPWPWTAPSSAAPSPHGHHLVLPQLTSLTVPLPALGCPQQAVGLCSEDLIFGDQLLAEIEAAPWPTYLTSLSGAAAACAVAQGPPRVPSTPVAAAATAASTDAVMEPVLQAPARHSTSSAATLPCIPQEGTVQMLQQQHQWQLPSQPLQSYYPAPPRQPATTRPVDSSSGPLSLPHGASSPFSSASALVALPAPSVDHPGIEPKPTVGSIWCPPALPSGTSGPRTLRPPATFPGLFAAPPSQPQPARSTPSAPAFFPAGGHAASSHLVKPEVIAAGGSASSAAPSCVGETGADNDESQDMSEAAEDTALTMTVEVPSDTATTTTTTTGGHRSPSGGGTNATSHGRSSRAPLTLDSLRSMFDVPSTDVVVALGISATDLKRRCRVLGIRRWPQRKLVSLKRLAMAVEEDGDLPAEEKKAILGQVTDNRARILADPDTELDATLKVLRQMQYKRHFMERRGLNA